MRLKKIIFYLLISSSFCLVQETSFAQIQEQNQYVEPLESREIDAQQWEKVVSEITYESQREHAPKPISKQDVKAQKDFEADWGPILNGFLVLLAIVVIAFLILKLMNAENLFSPRNRKINTSPIAIDLENIEEHLHESDLQKFIRQAVASEDYALAIRLYYLAVLKELSIKKQIKWEKDKTNGEYLRALYGKKEYKDFSAVTLIFERIWYGTEQINLAIFKEVEPKFLAFIDFNNH